MSQNLSHDEHYDPEGAKYGMWIFIFTELFLFGGLFLVYAVFRAKYSEDFHHAAAQLDTFIGTLNTVILLVSSMTAAMSLTAIQKADYKKAIALVSFTIILALGFMVNKYFEWGHKFEYKIWPGSIVLHPVVRLCHPEQSVSRRRRISFLDGVPPFLAEPKLQINCKRSVNLTLREAFFVR